MRFGLHIIGQNDLTHLAVGHDHHVFGRSLEPGGAPIDFDHLTDDVGFTPVLVNHDPVANSKRLLDVHRKADEYVENYVPQGNPYDNAENTRCSPNPCNRLIENGRHDPHCGQGENDNRGYVLR